MDPENIPSGSTTGVEEIHSFGNLSAFEKDMFDKMLPDLKSQIQKGVEFANK